MRIVFVNDLRIVNATGGSLVLHYYNSSAHSAWRKSIYVSLSIVHCTYKRTLGLHRTSSSTSPLLAKRIYFCSVRTQQNIKFVRSFKLITAGECGEPVKKRERNKYRPVRPNGVERFHEWNTARFIQTVCWVKCRSEFREKLYARSDKSIGLLSKAHISSE